MSKDEFEELVKEIEVKKKILSKMKKDIIEFETEIIALQLKKEKLQERSRKEKLSTVDNNPTERMIEINSYKERLKNK